MKHYFAVVLAACLSSGLHADYLFWQVVNNAEVPSGVKYDAGMLWATTGTFGSPSDTGGVLLESFKIGDSDTWVSAGTIQEAKDPSTSTQNNSVRVDCKQLTNPQNYSFYIELIKYDAVDPTKWSSVGFLSAETYANLETGKHIISDAGLAPATAVIWTGGSYSAVPEPTSAMLLLVGASLLALRRRRV